jgi:RNA polymerase sigma-70 factor, ECF subfamily
LFMPVRSLREFVLEQKGDHDDKALVQSLLTGEADSWERFVGRYSGFVATVARRLLTVHGAGSSNADVEDVTENVFVALMEKDFYLLRRYDSNHKLATYLGVIARTQSHRWLRSRKNVASLGEEAGAMIADPKAIATADQLVRVEARDAVRRAMEALTEREQKVLKLFYYQSANYQMISAELNLKVNSIGALLSRARAHLQEELKKINDFSDSDYRTI